MGKYSWIFEDDPILDNGTFLSEMTPSGFWGVRIPKSIESLMSDCNRIFITKVVYNDPATVVWWSDGSKTVVRCQKGNTYSPETGLDMAICKKVFGNDGRFNKVFTRWLPHDEV